jgi:HPr kinase/phosphorylase
VIVSRYDRGLLLRAAPNIAGKIEVRGVGICAIPHLCSAPLQLVVVLSNDVERMPYESRTANMMGIDVPSIELAAFEGSAAIKVELALKRLTDAPNAPLIARFWGVSESPEL